MGWFGPMSSIAGDVRKALGRLGTAPGFCCAAVLTLGLGIGANSAAFSVVNALLLRPLPYPRAHELAVSRARFSLRRFSDFRKGLGPLAELGAFRITRGDLAVGGAVQHNAWGCSVSADVFRVLGVGPRLGRGFQKDEGRGSSRVLILSDAAWKGDFAGDPQVVGAAAQLNGEAYTVVGIMPEGFGFPDSPTRRTDYWVPLDESGSSLAADAEMLQVVMRAGAGGGVEQAAVAMTAISKREGDPEPTRVELVPLEREVAPDERQALLLFWGAAACLLMLACANVATLQVARAAAREAETAIRFTLGASRGRVAWELLLESSLLAGGGALLALPIAFYCARWAAFWLPAGWTPADGVSVDQRVLGFTAAVALLSAVATGIAPAVRAARMDFWEVIQRAAPGTASSMSHSGRAFLVTVQVAVTLALVVGSGMLVRTLVRLWEVPLGFDSSHVMVVGVELPRSIYASERDWTGVIRRAQAGILDTPGVEDAGGTDALPFWGYSAMGVTAGGEAERGGSGSVLTQAMMVTPHYFSTMRIPMLRGRDFSEGDGALGRHVVIIDNRMAARYWPHQDPVGNRLRIDARPEHGGGAAEIVGVAEAVRQRGFREASEPTLYVPFAQFPSPGTQFVVRTRGEPAALRGAVTAAVRAAAPGSLCYDVTSMDQVLAGALAPQRSAAVVLGAFGIVALAAAVLGVYAFVAYTVRRRTREIGVRLALGSTRSRVAAGILKEMLRPVAAGIVVGLACSLVLGQLVRGLLFGVSPTDSLTLGGGAIGLACVAVLAAGAAALRAAMLDPVAALRHE